MFVYLAENVDGEIGRWDDTTPVENITLLDNVCQEAPVGSTILLVDFFGEAGRVMVVRLASVAAARGEVLCTVADASLQVVVL